MIEPIHIQFIPHAHILTVLDMTRSGIKTTQLLRTEDQTDDNQVFSFGLEAPVGFGFPGGTNRLSGLDCEDRV